MKEPIALYQQIQQEIKMQIISGRLKPGDKLPAEQQLCQHYSVSRITAKRAIDELAAEGLVRRIKGSGSYVELPRQEKRLLSREHIFHFILPFDASLGRGLDMIGGANDFLQQNGCSMNLVNTAQNPKKERASLQRIMSGDTCGIIYYPISRFTNWDLLIAAGTRRFPIVTVDKYTEHDVLGSVTSDNFTGAYDAVTYLIQNGHTNIGFLSDTADSVEERFYGYCSALRDHGLNATACNYNIGFLEQIREQDRKVYEAILNSDSLFGQEYIECFKPILQPLLEQPAPVTAILAINDYVAMYILKTALAMGIDIPGELSLIGFDNMEFSQHLEVPLTTVEQNFYQIGWIAAETLYNSLLGTESNAKKIIIPVSLIERSSVADIRKKSQKK